MTIREKALARLSLIALLIDFLVIIFLTMLISPQVSNFSKEDFWANPQDIEILFLPALIFVSVFLVYTVTINVLAPGVSFGRFCSGLILVDESGRKSPGRSTLLIRYLAQLKTLGLSSIRYQGLPGYSKATNCYLQSDWILKPTKASTAETEPSGVLKVRSGPHQGLSVRIVDGKNFKREGVFTIGKRKKDLDLDLAKDDHVSGFHCTIVRARPNGKLYLYDGDGSQRSSTNGTFVNGKKLDRGKSHELKPRNMLKIGETKIEFR